MSESTGDPGKSPLPPPETGRGPDPLSPSGQQTPQQPAEALVAFTPGQVVAGRFRIVRFIGRGGMGNVYQADDLELKEPVALKTVRADIAGDERSIERFRR